MENEERWLPVPSYEGFYEVSDHGNVRSLARTFVNARGRITRVFDCKLKPLLVGDRRYFKVVLCKNGKRKTFFMHVLVAMAFIGPRPKGMNVCHSDGDAFNNYATNLRYDTPSANCRDKIVHGTMPRGETNGSSKLTGAEVLEIRSSSDGYAVLARRYGVSISNIGSIKTRLTWGHI